MPRPVRLHLKQLDLPLDPGAPGGPEEHSLVVGGRRVRLRLHRNRRARRYVLRLAPDGAARVTIPRGGTIAEATQFAQRNSAWLEQQMLRLAARPTRPKAWLPGTEILLRGEPVRLELGVEGGKSLVRCGSESIPVVDSVDDLRPAVERHLRGLASREFPPRVMELAALHGLPVNRVTVRNQKSRWGSCSRRGTISLNWRLVQVPASVRDYLILHELAHLIEMNHSRRFWRQVERLCPGFVEAEKWLKKHSVLLR